MKLGKYNKLRIVRKVDFGLYLQGDYVDEILLPTKYVTADMHIGDEIEVFIYLDQEERPVATTLQPTAQVGDFAYLECSWVNQYGVFLSWGLEKDVFCPFREQKMRMEQGKSYIVYIMVDEESYRIMATAKVDRYLSKDRPPYRHGDHADVLVWQKTDLGFKVIVDNKYAGLVYKDQVFQDIHTGDRLQGYIQTVRPDGKLDITLQPTGRQQTTDFAETLLHWLQEHEGYCPLGDKSDAEAIRQQFQVSKKTFKRAVGDLYKRHLITLGETDIRLV